VLELQAEEMIAFAVRHPHNLCPKVLGAFGNGRGSGERGARDFERNLRCWPKSAVDGNQSSARGHVQGGCELQEVLAAVIATANKNRDRKRQSHPLASFCCRLALIQTCAPTGTRTIFSHLLGQTGSIPSRYRVFGRTVRQKLASDAVFAGKRKT